MKKRIGFRSIQSINRNKNAPFGFFCCCCRKIGFSEKFTGADNRQKTQSHKKNESHTDKEKKKPQQIYTAHNGIKLKCSKTHTALIHHVKFVKLSKCLTF